MRKDHEPDITITQQNMLHALKENEKFHKQGLGLRELRDAAYIKSTNTVDYNLRKLEARGLVERGEKTARSTFVTKEGKAFVQPFIEFLASEE